MLQEGIDNVWHGFNYFGLKVGLGVMQTTQDHEPQIVNKTLCKLVVVP